MPQVITDRNQHALDIAELERQAASANAEVSQALEVLATQLDSVATHGSDVEFASLLKVAQQLLRLDDHEMSRTLKVSRPTIGRWIRGDSEPHQLARTAIYGALAKKARGQARSIRK